jgi:hypothetical protein
VIIIASKPLIDLNIFKEISIGDTNNVVAKLSAKLHRLCCTNTHMTSCCDSHDFAEIK